MEYKYKNYDRRYAGEIYYHPIDDIKEGYFEEEESGEVS